MASLCPLNRAEDGFLRGCVDKNCAWWNERNERCSIFTIGDSVEDVALRLLEIRDIIDREVKL